jgi:predicted DNA-binding protein
MVNSQRGRSRVDVRLDDDIILKLEHLASETNVTVSYIVRQAISDYLIRKENAEAPDVHKDIRYLSVEEMKKAKS